MKFFTYSVLLIILMTGCSIAPEGSNVDTQFHMPLTYQNWRTNHYTTTTGIHACSISSGYNGIIVTVGKLQNGLDVVVASNRLMQPGATLTMNVGGKSFEAYDTYFPPETGRLLVEYMKKNDKAYLEWSEFSGPSGRERVHVQNTIQLNDFAVQLKECQK